MQGKTGSSMTLPAEAYISWGAGVCCTCQRSGQIWIASLVAEKHTVADFKVKLMYKSGCLQQESECSYRSSQLSKQVKVVCGESLLVQGH